MRTQPEDAEEESAAEAEPEHGQVADDERRHLRVVQAQTASGEPALVEPVDGELFPPQVQIDAWTWALENRHSDGSLPTGKEIADHFEHKERWGRLIKQWRQQGRFDRVPA